MTPHRGVEPAHHSASSIILVPSASRLVTRPARRRPGGGRAPRRRRVGVAGPFRHLQPAGSPARLVEPPRLGQDEARCARTLACRRCPRRRAPPRPCRRAAERSGRCSSRARPRPRPATSGRSVVASIAAAQSSAPTRTGPRLSHLGPHESSAAGPARRPAGPAPGSTIGRRCRAAGRLRTGRRAGLHGGPTLGGSTAARTRWVAISQAGTVRSSSASADPAVPADAVGRASSAYVARRTRSCEKRRLPG